MKGSPFQYVIIGLFVFGAIVGVIGFALFKGSGEPLVSVEVWGEIPQEAFLEATESISDQERFTFKYTYVAPEQFDERFISSLSTGQGPDIVLMSSERLEQHKARLLPISYDYYSQNRFLDTFLSQAGTAYFGGEGLLGLPLVTDPLILYWNEDLLRNGGIVEAPRTWDELPRMVEAVVEVGPTGQIIKGVLPFGSFENVSSAKASLSSLLLQANSPITVISQDGRLTSALNQSTSGGIVGSQYALNFFTEFADPYKSLYSWNTSLSNAETMFISGNLALYPEFASEATSLMQKNPNLSIRMAGFPQAQGSANKVVYGRFFGVSVARTAGEAYGSAVQASELLAGDVFSKALADTLNIAPARKSLFSSVTESNSMINPRVIYDSAVVSKTWKDPNPKETERIFSRMVHSVVSGVARTTEALSSAHTELNNLLRSYE